MNDPTQLMDLVTRVRGYVVMRWNGLDDWAQPPLPGTLIQREVLAFRRGEMRVNLNHRVITETDQGDYLAQQAALNLKISKPMLGERYFRLEPVK